MREKYTRTCLVAVIVDHTHASTRTHTHEHTSTRIGVEKEADLTPSTRGSSASVPTEVMHCSGLLRVSWSVERKEQLHLTTSRTSVQFDTTFGRRKVKDEAGIMTSSYEFDLLRKS